MPLTDEEIKAQEARIERVKFEHIQQKMQALIREAEHNNLVITIETRPLLPLAMRNYEMVGHVRKAR